MSVRVNLLPRETSARQAASRQRLIAAAAIVLLLILLAAVHLFQLGRVDSARTELAAEEERVTELQDEVASLREYEELRQQQAETQETLQTTLGGETGLAGILQNVAAVMPTDAQMDSLSITLGEEGQDPVTGAPTVGTMSATGKTLTSHAPGVERLLLSLEKVASFVDLFVNSSSLQEADEEVTTFTVESQIGSEVLTGRYQAGLPEELR